MLMFVSQFVVLLLMTTMMMMMAFVDARNNSDLKPKHPEENYHWEEIDLARAVLLSTTATIPSSYLQLSSSSSSSLSLTSQHQPELQPLVNCFSISLNHHHHQQQVGFSTSWTDGGGTQIRVS